MLVFLLLTLTLLLLQVLLPWDQLAIWAITVGANMVKATPFLGHGGPGAMLSAKLVISVMVSDVQRCSVSLAMFRW